MSTNRHQQAWYVLIVIGTFYVSIRGGFDVQTKHVFALLLSYMIVRKFSEKDEVTSEDSYNLVQAKLEAIGEPSHFYMDTNMILLYYDMLAWRVLNPDNYEKSKMASNVVLKLLRDSEEPIVFSVHNYQVASEHAAVALNYMSAFELSLPNAQLVKKLKVFVRRLQVLLTKHLRQMRSNCAAIERAKGPKGPDGRGGRDVTWAAIPEETSPHGFDLTAPISPFDTFGPIG